MGGLRTVMPGASVWPSRSQCEEIDELIETTPDWRGTTLAELRRIIHDADPEIIEEKAEVEAAQQPDGCARL